MKIYDTEDSVTIVLKKDEIRFSNVYGDHQGFYLRFSRLLDVDFITDLERATPTRVGQRWTVPSGF